VQGIKDLCDETPVRQGTRFWHHGKSFEAIKEVHGTYCERAEHIGAYLGEELIGFIKMVYVDNFAKTMHVISKEKYFDKRPTNALIAKAVEICAEKGLSHFVYGEYKYLGKEKSSLAEFKRRNGFEEAKYPRYFAPLTMKGRLAVQTGLHLGMRNCGSRSRHQGVAGRFGPRIYRRSQSANPRVGLPSHDEKQVSIMFKVHSNWRGPKVLFLRSIHAGPVSKAGEPFGDRRRGSSSMPKFYPERVKRILRLVRKYKIVQDGEVGFSSWAPDGCIGRPLP